MIVATFFFAITLLLTFPLIINLSKSIYGFHGFLGDPLGTVWWIWWHRHAFANGISSNFTSIIGYPFGVDRNSQPIAPLLDYPVALLNLLIKNEITTYNIFVISGFLLTAICAYYLVKYLTKNILSGILAGIIYGFCPNQLMHSAQHLGFALNLWIPLFVLCIFKLKDNPNYSRAIVCGVIYACCTLTNYYYGYFIAIFVILFLLFWYKAFKNNIRYFLLTGLIALMIIFPFLLLLMFKQKGGVDFGHPAGDLIKYSARWYDYLLPSEFHPLLGKWAQLFERHYFERSLYLGFLPAILALWGIVKSKWDKTTLFFLIAAISFFVFSINPIFNIGRIKIPNLSFFAYKVLPMFRVYARMGIFVILSVSIMAGFGLKYILENNKTKIRRCFIVGFCIVFILFEFINFPPFHIVDLSKIPQVYEWLKEEPVNVAIAEYPFVRSIEAKQSEYLFYQRAHKRRLINGAPEGTIGDAFRKEIQYLQNEETTRLLAFLGVDYVIMHKDSYTDKELMQIRENKGLAFAQEFPDAVVYKIVARPGEIVTIFWNNFASWEKWDDGNLWRWIGNNAAIWVGNGRVKQQIADSVERIERKKVDVSFKIISFAKERNLEIYVNGTLRKSVKNFPADNLSKAQEVEIKNVILSPGENIIKFYTPQGEDRIGDIMGNDDDRRVCFAISEFKMQNKE
jgi:hypothetical protein